MRVVTVVVMVVMVVVTMPFPVRGYKVFAGVTAVFGNQAVQTHLIGRGCTILRFVCAFGGEGRGATTLL